MLFTRSLLRARKNSRGRAAAVITALALVFTAAVGGVGASTADAASQNAVLSIDKSTVATTVLPGDTFVWEMQVGCASLETICVNASLHDSVPADFRVQDVRVVGVTQNATVTQGAYDATNGTPIDVAFNETSSRFPGIHGITDGQKLSVLVTVLLPTSTPASKDGVAVTNWGSVSADNAATQKDDSTVTLSVPATVGVDLTTKWGTASQLVDPTATNTIVLTAQNTSNINASSITVVDPKTGTPNPFDSVQFTSFGSAFTLPDGAANVAVTAITGASSTTGPSAATPTLPTLPSGKTLADITGFSLAFTSSSGEKISPFGAAGSIVLNVKQRSSVPTNTTTTVSNTAFATVATTRGTATDDATAAFAITPLLSSVSATKSFAPTTVLAGGTSVVTVKGTNTSNTTLDSLTITEPGTSLATNPFASNLVFSGFGATGNGDTTTGGHWPNGATAAKVTYDYSDGSNSSFTLAKSQLTGWDDPTGGKTVTGFVVAYTGSIATGEAGTVPFLVTTKSSTAASVVNRVQVDGVGPAGAATPATKDATLTVTQPTIVSDITKSLSAGANVAGQEVVATMTGKVTSQNVPVRQLVIEDSPNSSGGSTFWTAFSASRVSSTVVPAGSTLTVKVTTDGTNYTTAGGPYAAGTTVALDLTSTHATGVRFVFDATGGGAFSATSPITFTARLVFTLKAAQATNALTWKDCAISRLAGDNGVTGGAASPACANVTLSTGTAPAPVLSQTTSKSWGDSQVLIPNDTANGVYPSTSLTFTAKNTSPLDATGISLHDATAGTTPFDYFDITKIATLSVPAGADATLTRVQLLDKNGATIQDVTGSKGGVDVVTWAKALTAADLADVYDIRVSVQGVFAPNAQLQVKLTTLLRKATRTDPTTSITAAMAAKLGTVNNTVTGVVNDGMTTISKDASASIKVIPAAASALGAALSKSFSPSTGTIYSTDPNRTVALTLGVAENAGTPNVLVVEDTTPTFWNAFDFSGVTSVTGTATSPNTNYYAQIDYLTGRTFTTVGGGVVTSPGTWKTGTQFLLSSGGGALTAAQKALPSGVMASDVQGIRITYTAKNGASWTAASVNGFSGQQAKFTVAPRPQLRSGGATSDGSTAANPGETVAGTVTNTLTGTADDGLRPTPVTLTPVTAPFVFTPGNQSIVISKTPKANAVVPGEETPFKLSVSNTGSTPLVDPVLTDIIPWDATGALLEYNPVQYTAASFEKSPSTASITTDPSRITVTTTDVVVSGAQTTQIAFSFPAGTVILPGESYVLTLPMQVRAGVERNTVFLNTFLLTAAGSYHATDTAQVTVLEGGSYARIKDVQENVPAGEQPTGNYNTNDKSSTCVNDGGFYRVPCLVETKPGGTETWRLRVINTGNLPTSTMTMVDVFPKAGDTGTSKQLSALSRGSLWTPIFLGDVDYTSLPAGTDVTVWYQTAAQTTCVLTGDPASSDPLGAGCDDSQWIRSTTTDLSELSNPSTVTAIKLQFDFTTELQPGDQVAVTYQTQTPDHLPSGVPAYTPDGAPTPAWGSFVAFTTTDKSSGPEYESLEPNKAGIGFATPVAVGDDVWIDANGNGRQDSGEPGLAGVTVKLFDAGNTLVGTTTTDADGHYLFDSLYPGDYHATFTLTAAQQAKYRFTDEVGTDTTKDSNADKLSGATDVFHLDAADVSLPNIVSADDYQAATGTQIKALFIDPSIDAGVVPNTVSVGDYVWNDANKNGVQDKDETGIKGVVLSIVGPDGKPVVDATNATVGEATTDADGKYEFTDLPVLKTGESYTVKIDFAASAIPLFSLFSSPIDGTKDTALDSSRNTAASGDLTTNGDSDQTLDFGFFFADLTTLPFDPQDPATLAFTGLVVGPILGWIGGLLAAGITALALSRRRRGRHA